MTLSVRASRCLDVLLAHARDGVVQERPATLHAAFAALEGSSSSPEQVRSAWRRSAGELEHAKAVRIVRGSGRRPDVFHVTVTPDHLRPAADPRPTRDDQLRDQLRDQLPVHPEGLEKAPSRGAAAASAGDQQRDQQRPETLDEQEQRARIELLRAQADCYRAVQAAAERLALDPAALTRLMGAAPAQEQAAAPPPAEPVERPAARRAADPKPDLLPLDGDGDGSRLAAWVEQATGSALPDELVAAGAVLERTSGAEEEHRRAALLRVVEESRRPAGCRNPPGFARFVLAGMDDAQARGVIATHLRTQRSPMQHASDRASSMAAATREAMAAARARAQAPEPSGEPSAGAA